MKQERHAIQPVYRERKANMMRLITQCLLLVAIGMSAWGAQPGNENTGQRRTEPAGTPPPVAALRAVQNTCAQLIASPNNTTWLQHLCIQARNAQAADLQAALYATYAAGLLHNGQTPEAHKTIQYLQQTFPSSPHLAVFQAGQFDADCPKCSGVGSASATCARCSGRQVCPGCNGQKKLETIAKRIETCLFCRGTGQCATCNGSGQQTIKCQPCYGRGRVVSKELIKNAYVDLLQQTKTLASTLEQAVPGLVEFEGRWVTPAEKQRELDRRDTLAKAKQEENEQKRMEEERKQAEAANRPAQPPPPSPAPEAAPGGARSSTASRASAAPPKAQAQYDRGVRYNNGDGVAHDPAEAARCCRHAADQGHVNAQYNLGVCYANGQGVARDSRIAYGWFLVAAAAGSRDAAGAIHRVEPVLSPAEITEARQWSRTWKPGTPPLTPKPAPPPAETAPAVASAQVPEPAPETSNAPKPAPAAARPEKPAEEKPAENKPGPAFFSKQQLLVAGGLLGVGGVCLAVFCLILWRKLRRNKGATPAVAADDAALSVADAAFQKCLDPVPGTNEAFLDHFAGHLPALFKRVSRQSADAIMMLVAFDEERWLALLALLHEQPDRIFLGPETHLKKKVQLRNNGYCDLYVPPASNGRTLAAGIFVLPREWLFTQLCWLKDLPPLFIQMVKDEKRAGHFTVVVFGSNGMCVRHLPLTETTPSAAPPARKVEKAPPHKPADASSLLPTPAAALKKRLAPGISIAEVHRMFGKPYEECRWPLLRCDHHEVWRTVEGRLRVFYMDDKVEKWAVEP